MRNPEIILNTLSSHSKVSDYKYERIYRILFNEEMFMLACCFPLMDFSAGYS